MAVIETLAKDMPLGSIIVGRSLEYQVRDVRFCSYETFSQNREIAYSPCFSVMDREQLKGVYVVTAYALDADRNPAKEPVALVYLTEQTLKIEERE